MDFTVKRHQKTGQNKTKDRADRPKATPRAEVSFIRVTSLHDRRLTTSNITAQLNQSREKMLTSTVKRRLSEAGLYGRNVVKKAVLRKKKCQKASASQGV